MASVLQVKSLSSQLLQKKMVRVHSALQGDQFTVDFSIKNFLNSIAVCHITRLCITLMTGLEPVCLFSDISLGSICYIHTHKIRILK